MTASTLDRSPILTRDTGLVGVSLDRFADQLRDGWRQAAAVRLPSAYRSVTSIALCGMGGSHLGADILRSALADQLSIPMTIVADYGLPAWVNSKTLVICSSYSGTTEETLTALKAAVKRRAKIVVVTHGGALATAAKKLGVPLYQYAATENPSNQPRLGVAYGMMAMLMCWNKLGLVKITDAEVARLSTVAWEATKRFSTKKPAVSNLAKQLALTWEQSIPFLIGAEWTAGNLHSLVNQIHENAKTYADFRLLPDLNHHLLEGLRNRAVTKQFSVLMILDQTYNTRTQVRFTLTKKIIQQLGGNVASYTPRGATRLEKAIDLLAFGGYVSWYLAAARKVQPADIPTVNYLKQQLAKK
jgi:glucose/mannose-6-phosphate isomerase